MLENESSSGCLGGGSLREQGHPVGENWAFWEAICGVFQERALLTGIYFTQVSFSDDTWTLLLYSGHQVLKATCLKGEVVCEQLPTLLSGEFPHQVLPLWSSRGETLTGTLEDTQWSQGPEAVHLNEPSVLTP